MKADKINTATLMFIILLFALTAYASDTSDTPEARLKAAKRYLEVIPMSEMIENSINEMARQIPPEKRDEFIRFMKKGMRVEFLEKLALDSIVKIFTAEELNTLADFYGSEVGKSIMRKFGEYMGEVMPALQQELRRVVQELQQEGELH